MTRYNKKREHKQLTQHTEGDQPSAPALRSHTSSLMHSLLCQADAQGCSWGGD